MVDTPRPASFAYTPPTSQTAYGPSDSEMTLKGGGGDPERGPGQAGPIYSKRDMDIENDEDAIQQGRDLARSK